MEAVWRFFVLVYYSLATWVFSLLVAKADTTIDGEIDTTKEAVWLFSVIGLGFTMLDALTTLVTGIKNTMDGLPWQEAWHPKQEQPLSYIRDLGTAGVYLATFLYATRSRKIEEQEWYPGNTDEESFATDIPFLLAATMAVLGGVLSDLPSKAKETKCRFYTSIRPPIFKDRSGTNSYYM